MHQIKISLCDCAFRNIQPQYWMFGLAFPDLFKQGVKAGVAIGQPLIVAQIRSLTAIYELDT
jgi:hypothetical protein